MRHCNSNIFIWSHRIDPWVNVAISIATILSSLLLWDGQRLTLLLFALPTIIAWAVSQIAHYLSGSSFDLTDNDWELRRFLNNNPDIWILKNQRSISEIWYAPYIAGFSGCANQLVFLIITLISVSAANHAPVATVCAVFLLLILSYFLKIATRIRRKNIEIRETVKRLEGAQ